MMTDLRSISLSGVRVLAGVVALTFVPVSALEAHAATLSTLALFNNTNGKAPAGGLIRVGNKLYGTTSSGGANGFGTVFSIPITGGTPTTLATFDGANGRTPFAGVVVSSDTLYGTTQRGGLNGLGTVYSMPLTGGNPKTLATFDGINGSYPFGGVTLSNDILYGTTVGGGAGGAGTVFSVPITGGNPTTLTSFDGSNGSNPYGGVTISGETLYGATSGTGGDAGTVYSVPIGGGPHATLASFENREFPSSAIGDLNGTYPRGKVILVGTTLYGTTYLGGTEPTGGTVYSVPITAGARTKLLDFTGPNGLNPQSGVVRWGDTLYGTTSLGGANSFGTVFSVPVTGGPATVLANFSGGNGNQPFGDLLLWGNALYGTTTQGGIQGQGSIFKISNINSLTGDFDNNAVVNASDIDALYATNPGTIHLPADPLFDLNVDGQVSLSTNTPGSDADHLIRTLLGVEYGDANLDHLVNFDDLLALAQHYGNPNDGWANGNFDGLAGVDFSDLLLLAQNYGGGALDDVSMLTNAFQMDWNLALAIVPEPTAVSLCTVALASGVRRKR